MRLPCWPREQSPPCVTGGGRLPRSLGAARPILAFPPHFPVGLLAFRWLPCRPERTLAWPPGPLGRHLAATTFPVPGHCCLWPPKAWGECQWRRDDGVCCPDWGLLRRLLCGCGVRDGAGGVLLVPSLARPAGQGRPRGLGRGAGGAQGPQSSSPRCVVTLAGQVNLQFPFSLLQSDESAWMILRSPSLR